jgi:hypothetical protein
VQPQPPALTYCSDPGDDVKRLTSQAGSHVTGDELANAVCHYSLVLARIGAIDVVDIPVVGDRPQAGRWPDTHRARIVVGWRAGVVAVTVPHVGEEPEEIDTILDLYSRAAAALPRGQAFSDDEIDRLGWPDL